MSFGLYPVFNPHVDDVTFDADGVLLLNEHEVLDDIADDLDLMPLTTYCDNRVSSPKISREIPTKSRKSSARGRNGFRLMTASRPSTG